MHLLTSDRSQQVFRWVIVTCLTYVMLRPVSHNGVLLPVLAILLSASAVLAYCRGRVSRELLIVVGGVVLIGVFGALIGWGNPGVWNGALVWIFAPVMFGTLAAAGDSRLVRLILMASAVTTIATSVLIFVYVGGETEVIHRILPTFLLDEVGASFDLGPRGSTAVLVHALSTLVAAAPMWLTAALLPTHPMLPSRALAAAAGSAALVATLLSGRTALIVVTVLVPGAVWLLWRVLTRRLPRSRWRTFAPLGFVVLGATGAALSGVLAQTWARVAGTLTGQYATEDDAIRGEQSPALIAAWLKSPVWGHGWGATIEGYVRSEARPWNFELQYHLVLFQVGVVGALALLAVVVVAARGLLAATQVRPDLLPLVLVVSSGAAALVVANASNPYLQAPGNMWPIYLMLMVANWVLVTSRPSGNVVVPSPICKWDHGRGLVRSGSANPIEPS